MNLHEPTAKGGAKIPAGMSPEEWQARVDLAAVYRLCAYKGWDDLIYNHCSMRVPGESKMLLMKQHELLWDEVTASNLKKVDMTADLDERSGVNRPGFTLHGGILQGRPDVNCVVHVHTDLGMALLRRAKPTRVANVLSSGDLELDRERRRVYRSGREITLGPTEFRLLEFFMQSPGRVFSRAQLLDGVWGRDIYIDERTVDVHIGRLRKTLNEGGDGDPIRTVRGSGYAFDERFGNAA